MRGGENYHTVLHRVGSNYCSLHRALDARIAKQRRREDMAFTPRTQEMSQSLFYMRRVFYTSRKLVSGIRSVTPLQRTATLCCSSCLDRFPPLARLQTTPPLQANLRPRLQINSNRSAKWDLTRPVNVSTYRHSIWRGYRRYLAESWRTFDGRYG